jgi:hypothetical protein
MAMVIDDRHDEFDDLETEEVEETEVVDNDDGIDLDGYQDEEVDAELDETETEEEDLEESDEGELQEEPTEEEEEEGEEEETEEETEDTVDPNVAKIAELERNQEMSDTKYKRFETQVKETLEKLGVKVDGKVEDALDEIVAEAEGKTLEEYRKEKDEKEELENARKLLAKQKFEQMASNDLAEIKKSFPDLVNVTHIRKCFDNDEAFIEFGRLRDAGVAPKTAYMAVNGDKIRTAQEQAVQRKTANNGKGHIQSVAPKKATDNSVVMPKSTLLEWRENFPELTDSEIRKLYRQTL